MILWNYNRKLTYLFCVFTLTLYRLLAILILAWSALPADIHSSASVTELKQKLKTRLFEEMSYPDTQMHRLFNCFYGSLVVTHTALQCHL